MADAPKLNNPLAYALASVGPGWKNLVMAVFQMCDDAEVQIGQVKEKYGGLRIYLASGGRSYIYDILDAFETKSVTICERCGNQGKLRMSSWIKTLCKECNGTHKST